MVDWLSRYDARWIGRWHIEYTTDDDLSGETEFTIGPDYEDVEGRIDPAKR